MVKEFHKALLLGKGESQVNEVLIDLVDDLFQIQKADICPQNLNEFDAVICMDSSWLNPASMVEMFCYVLNGGALICIAEGTDLSMSHELCNVIGARMEEHPAMTHLVFTPICRNGDRLEQDNFELVEIPYRYRFDPYTKRTPLLTYRYGKLDFPAMWTNSFGAGRVVCLSAGRSEGNISCYSVRRLLYRAALWASGEEENPC